jgi:hypothetical protein
MMDMFRRTLLIGLLSLLLIVLTGMATGQAGGGGPADPADGGAFHDGESAGQHGQDGGFPTGVPVEVLHSGNGFALRGNDSFLLRLKVESLLPLKASQIQSLLQSNKSLEEIRDDIEGQNGEKVYRGSLILERRIYPLLDIQIAALGNNTTSLQAGLAKGENAANASETIAQGNVSVMISPSDGGMVGKGELHLAAGPQAGRYTLLLEMEPRRHGKEMKKGR